jgi:hypothetical protein
MKQSPQHRSRCIRPLLTLALALAVPFGGATALAQQQQTTTSTSTTRTGIDPATGMPYTSQQMHQDTAATSADGAVQHTAAKSASTDVVVNPDGTESRHSVKKTHAKTVVNNPDGTTVVTTEHTSATNNNTTPQ